MSEWFMGARTSACSNPTEKMSVPMVIDSSISKYRPSVCICFTVSFVLRSGHDFKLGSLLTGRVPCGEEIINFD